MHSTKPTHMRYVATVVGSPSGGWSWGRRSEIRVHRADLSPVGHGYRDRCVRVVSDVDARHKGPRSRFDSIWAEALALCRELERAERDSHRHMWE